MKSSPLRAFYNLGLCAALLTLGAALHAQSETVTYLGTGTGSLNGVGFTNANFDFVVTYDPSLPLVGGAYATTSAMMTLSGFNGDAAFSVTGVTNEYVVSTAGLTEFATQGPGQQYNPGFNAQILAAYQFEAWDGVSAATFLSPAGVFNQFVGAETTQGLLTMNTGTMTSFSVSGTAVPEPSTYAALFGVGALGFAAYRRRRTQLRREVKLL